MAGVPGGGPITVGADLPSGDAAEPQWVVVIREYVIPIAVFLWMVKFLALGVVRPFFTSGMAAHMNNREVPPAPPAAEDDVVRGGESDDGDAPADTDADAAAFTPAADERGMPIVDRIVDDGDADSTTCADKTAAEAASEPLPMQPESPPATSTTATAQKANKPTSPTEKKSGKKAGPQAAQGQQAKGKKQRGGGDSDEALLAQAERAAEKARAAQGAGANGEKIGLGRAVAVPHSCPDNKWMRLRRGDPADGGEPCGACALCLLAAPVRWPTANDSDMEWHREVLSAKHPALFPPRTELRRLDNGVRDRWMGPQQEGRYLANSDLAMTLLEFKYPKRRYTAA